MNREEYQQAIRGYPVTKSERMKTKQEFRDKAAEEYSCRILNVIAAGGIIKCNIFTN